MGGRAGAFMDESISAVIDPVGEEGRELLGDDPPGIYMHCGARDSSFRIGSKLDFIHFESRKGSRIRKALFGFS